MKTEIPGLREPRRGKVREVYDLGDKLLIVATDRISAFDVIMANGVPGKGIVLNQISAFWFHYLQDVCPNHVVSTCDDDVAMIVGADFPDLKGRCTIAKKAVPLAIECVARGYIAGSLFKEYRAKGRNILGFHLHEGLLDGSRLPEAIFSPATKAQEGHDENISFNQAVDIVGKETAERARDWTLELYQRAAQHAESRGLILADTKFEFGMTDDGLILIDEALTPDSSRFWEASLWKPGGAQPSFDKQFVRDYLESIHWDKRPPGPTLPDRVIEGTLKRYTDAFERITGRPIVFP